jgi:hypothetical protein
MFETEEQLRAIPWIKQKIDLDGFSRLSMSENVLMLEFQDGKYFVIGRFLDDWPTFLPQWEHKVCPM